MAEVDARPWHESKGLELGNWLQNKCPQRQFGGQAKVDGLVRTLTAAHERLVSLLQTAPLPAAHARELQAAAASVVAAIGVLGGSKRRSPFAAWSEPLIGALSHHLAAGGPLAEQAATALGNLSTSPEMRIQMLASKTIAAMLALVKKCPPAGEADETLLPNTLAALHNVSLLPAAMAEIATVETAASLLPRVSGPTPLARRAVGILSKCATRCPEVVALLVSRGVVPQLAAMLEIGRAHV